MTWAQNMWSGTNPSTSEQILSEIAGFLADFQIGKAEFGIKAAGDGSLVARLRRGDGINIKKLDRIRAYMAGQRAERAARETGA